MKGITLYKKYIAKRKAPVNFKQEDHDVFGNAWEKEIPESTLVFLKNAWILGDGIFHPASFSFFSNHTHLYKRTWIAKLRSFLALRKSVQYIDKAIWITDNLSFNYFHWFLDALPRLIAAKEYHHDHIVLLPQDYKNFSYVEASLQILNVKCSYAKSANVRIRQLVLPSHIAGTGNYNHEVVNELRERMIGAPEKPFRKIYLSREKSVRRKIVNEKELQKLLTENGFEIHYFEDYPFKRQMELMKETSVLVGLHGAGLANMLFMPEGGNVLEIRNLGDHHNNCYFTLASELNHSYYYHLGKGSKADTFDADITVDLNAFGKLIKEII